MPDKIIRQIDIGGVDGLHEIAAKYLQAGTVNMTWDNIVDLIDGGFEVYVYGTQPTPEYPETSFPPHNPATPEDYARYHNQLVLVEDEQAAAGTYIEYVISDLGGSYAWEQIGSTQVDLSNKVDKGTYTTSAAGGGNTSEAPTATYTTSSAPSYTATGEAVVNVPTLTLGKADFDTSEEETESAGGHTIQGSNFTFTGNTATISNVKVSKVDVTVDPITLTPSGTIGGSQTVAGHNHTINPAYATFNYVTGATLNQSGAHSHAVNVATENATIQNLTKAASAGDHVHTVNATTAALTYLSGGSVVSDGAHTHGVTKTTGTVTYVSGGTISSDGAHTHSVTLTTATKTLQLDKQETESAEHSHEIDIDTLLGKIHPETAVKQVVPTISTLTYVKTPASLSSSSNWGFATANTSVMKTATVNNNVLSWEAVVAGSQSSITYTPATTATVNYVSGLSAPTTEVASRQPYSAGLKMTLTGGAHTHAIQTVAETLTYLTNVEVLSAGAHSHTFNKATAAANFLTDVSVNSAGAHTHAFNGTNATATVMTGATLSSGGAHTHALDGSISTITYVTGATLSEAGGHSHSVNAALNTVTVLSGVQINNGGTFTVQGSNFSFNGNAVTITPSASATLTYAAFEYQPTGSIGGSQYVAAHSHKYLRISGVTIPAQTATGSASVAIAAHEHNVTVPKHSHSIGNHTHDVDLN